MPRTLNLITIHCSATPNGNSLFRGTSGKPGFQTPADVIDGWHRDRGFRRTPAAAKIFNSQLQHIGYHFVIACNGALFTGRGLDEVGAHVANHNANSIGICMTGTDAFTAEQWTALENLLRKLSQDTGIPLDVPKRVQAKPEPTLVGGVCGHRDLSPDRNGDGKITPNEFIKICPGFDVATYLKAGLKPQAKHVLAAKGGAA